MKHTIIAPVALLFVMALSCAGTEGETHGQRDASEPGRQLYSMQCTLCHGKDGKLGLSGARDLTLSPLMREEMIAVVTHGRNAMAGYGKVLSPEQIEQVVDHVRTLHVEQ